MVDDWDEGLLLESTLGLVGNHDGSAAGLALLILSARTRGVVMVTSVAAATMSMTAATMMVGRRGGGAAAA